MARLWVNVGANQGVTPAHVVGCILGETGLPSTTVGKVEIQADHALVEVSGQHSRAILSRLNRAQLAGRRLKARLDS